MSSWTEISVVWNEEDPLYLQLYRYFRSMIQGGGIRGGTRLPSVRALRLQLNVSKTTIETAYQMLLAEGYAVSKPRSGLFAVHPWLAQNSLQTSLASAAPAARLTSPSQAEALIDFSPAQVDASAFPHRVWKQSIHLALEEHGRNLFQYGDPRGEPGLRMKLALYLRQSRGVACTADQIIVGSGIPYSLHVLSKLLPELHSMAMEDPGYAPVRESFLSQGCRVHPIPVSEEGMLLEPLFLTDAQAVYVTPSHQFPTGGVMPFFVRQKLLNWAYSRGAYIIEDDYDGEFRYLGKPIASLQSLDQRGNVIYIGTFSKVFTPALRMNYMVLPEELAERCKEVKHLFSGVSRVEQWAMEHFIENGHWSRHIRKMRNIYRRKHVKLLELLHSHFSGRVEVMGASAGLHVQAQVRCSSDTKQLIHLAGQHGVRVYGLEEMSIGERKEGQPIVYIGFGGVSEEDMEKGIQLLRQAWGPVLE
jgi:GntR family transcriptional regulator / MocR family aminotransferase